MIEDFITRADGTTNVVRPTASMPAWCRTRSFATPTCAHREYQGDGVPVELQLTSRWTVNGHYTLQLKNDGNYEGEAINTPGATSRIGDYPEAFNAAAAILPGRPAADFQRHRLRLWSIYNFGMGRAGDLSVSGLWRVDSGRVYSLAAHGPAADRDPAQPSCARRLSRRADARRSTSARAGPRPSRATACSIPTSATTFRSSDRSGPG